ncbi:hypothetical protein T11_11503 [Trichinella zimbabwensis]|uniref:Uncharacterized protein n=1 Tax=Trichinella zimbabwensis TaxID=268475 RepID=A0A0V1HWD3_9BILA|nr:hypothetical protein T11_11503 [Trichinella zimbabwensis]
MNQHRFLSSCRNTSHSTTRRSPAELLGSGVSHNDWVTFCTAEASYRVEVGGKQHQKHADHLRFCEADEPKEEEEVHEETPLTARSQRPADQHPKRSTKPPAHPFFRNRPRALSGLCLHKEK